MQKLLLLVHTDTQVLRSLLCSSCILSICDSCGRRGSAAPPQVTAHLTADRREPSMLSPTGILYSRRSHLLLGVPISHDRRILYRMIRPATLWCSPVYLPERPRTPMRTLEGGVDQQHRRCRCPHIDLCCSDREPSHLRLMREERKEDFDAHRLSIQDLDSAFLLPVPSLSLHASSHTSMSHQWELLASCGGLPLCSATFPVAFPHILMSKEISDSHHLQVFICHARGLHFGPENADTRADVRPSLKTHRRAQVGRATAIFGVAWPPRVLHSSCFAVPLSRLR